MANTCALMIGGESVKTAQIFDVLNPANGELVGRSPDAQLSDLDHTVTASEDAFFHWSAQSDAELQAACEAVTAKIGEHAEELAELITHE